MVRRMDNVLDTIYDWILRRHHKKALALVLFFLFCFCFVFFFAFGLKPCPTLCKYDIQLLRREEDNFLLFTFDAFFF
jgi:hypothetical protein